MDDHQSVEADDHPNVNVTAAAAAAENDKDDDDLLEQIDKCLSLPKLETTAIAAATDLEGDQQKQQEQTISSNNNNNNSSAEVAIYDDHRSSSSNIAHVSYEQEIERLRKLIADKEAENASLECKLTDYEQQSKQRIEQLHLNFTQKLEQTLKNFQDSQKDKTSSMIMKYAEAEKRCIDLNRSIDLLQSKLADANKEKQRLNERWESAKAETHKLNKEYEKKTTGDRQYKEGTMIKLKENLIISEAREKASQLRMKNELDAHENTKRLLDTAFSEIKQLRQSNKEKSDGSNLLETEVHEAAAANAAADHETTAVIEKKTESSSLTTSIVAIGSSASTDDMNVTTAPKKIDENQNEIKKARSNECLQVQQQQQQHSTNAERDQRTLRELYALKSQLKEMTDERTTLKDKIQCLEQERRLQEASFIKYKETLQSQKQMNKDLLNEILQLRELQETLANEQVEKKKISDRVSSLSNEINELQEELSASQQKQGELLSFTSKLTEKITQLQSDNTVTAEKLRASQEELEQLRAQLAQSKDSSMSQVADLSEKLAKQIDENKRLQDELSDKQKRFDELNTKLMDLQDENQTIMKKHAANIRDLTKQLQILQKKIDSSAATAAAATTSISSSSHAYTESTMTTPIYKSSPSSVSEQNISSFLAGTGGSINNNPETFRAPPSKTSRTNSINSLNDNNLINFDASRSSTAMQQQHARESFDSSSNCMNPSFASSFNSSVNAERYSSEMILGNDDVYVVDVDKQKIIDKIVKLQKMLARRNEKIDFLQDHVNQLTTDIKRKTRIIQAFAMNEDVGAFTSEAHDAIKREMSNKTGIMSPLYQTNANYLQTAQFINSNQSKDMSKEMCLEINAKLQALLEDTLIKNITLKDSLETLGVEIARLSKENRQLKNKE